MNARTNKVKTQISFLSLPLFCIIFACPCLGCKSNLWTGKSDVECTRCIGNKGGRNGRLSVIGRARAGTKACAGDAPAPSLGESHHQQRRRAGRCSCGCVIYT